MYEDYFSSIEGQNYFIRKPKISNGLGVIILGGSGCYVTEDTSDFHKNYIRNEFLNELSNMGYTVGYSNSHNKSWGSDFSIRDIENLYKVMIEKFNIQNEIILIGVSMGGILALNLLKNKNVEISKLILVKPVMDLIAHKDYILTVEKEDRISEELSFAYNIEKEYIVNYLEANKFYLSENDYKRIPIKIIYGDSDVLVPFENNINVLNILNIYNDVELISVKDANHKDDNLFFNFNLYKEFLKN